MTPDDFAAACRDNARAMRRLPAELKRELRGRVRDDVATVVADDIRAAGSGVYARRVAPTAKVRAGAEPTVVVGGGKRVASGGARGRDLVFGVNFGGKGDKVKAVPRAATRQGRGAGYRRHSTRQFMGRREPIVFGTIGRNLDRYLDRWADVVTDLIDRSLGHGRR